MFPQQFYATSKDLSFVLAGGKTKLAGCKRTKSRRINLHVLDTPIICNIGTSHPWHWWCFNSVLTRILHSAPAQGSPIPTSTHVTHILARTHWLRMAARSIYGTWCDTIRIGQRLGDHCPTTLQIKAPLFEMRAPNEIVHKDQDTVHFLIWTVNSI